MNAPITENVGTPAPGSAREPGIFAAVAAGFHVWGSDLKPEGEGITSEEYEMLAVMDRNGEFA
jgi:hypothetical protein